MKFPRATHLLLGFVGTHQEAEEIRKKIGEFLQTLGLNLSEEKTLITHATEESARFLGYEIRMAMSNTRMCRHARSINGHALLSVPDHIAKEWKNRYTHNGKPCHRKELLEQSDHDIVATYGMEFQGLVNYYVLAYDVAKKLYPVKWAYEQSLVKTLASKHKRPVTWAYRKYKRKLNNGITGIVVETIREGKKPLIAKFGATPICQDKRSIIPDQKTQLFPSRNELIKRLLANQCEICGSTESIQVHHIRKLKDIENRYKGRPDPPRWAVRQMEIRRKTLVVCEICHQEIHAGTYDGPKLK